MAACYYWINGKPGVSNVAIDQKSCGPSISGVQYCCTTEDTCLEDSICRYTHPRPGGSDYYIGFCTDPSFPAPCSKSCSDMPATDIVFTGSSTSLWACCYQQPGGTLDCSNPGNETFYAPSPESLTIQGASSSTTSGSSTSPTSSIASSFTSSTSSTSSASSASSVSSASSTSSTSSTSTLPTSASSTPPPASLARAPSSNSLSAGAKAGIGIAASIVGLSVVFALGFFLWKRRPQRPQKNRAYGSDNLVSSPTARQEYFGELNAEQQAELDGNAMSELEGRSKAIGS